MEFGMSRCPSFDIVVPVTKRRPIIAVLSAVIFVGVVIAWAWPKEREPEYNGKKLSEWLHVGFLRQEEAKDAVRHIGTNALPCALSWLRYEPSPIRAKLVSGLKRCLPLGIKTSSSFRYLSMGGSARRHMNAQVCFYILREEASPAVPELVRLMFQTNSPYTAQSAEWALTSVSNEAIRTLITILECPTQPSRQIVVKFLGKYADRFGTNATPAVPALIGCMHETNRDLAHEAATTLGKLQLEPVLVVPALLDGLQHEDAGVRVASATALGRFEVNAGSAVPALLKAAQADPETRVQEAADWALRMIAPEVLETNRVDYFE